MNNSELIDISLPATDNIIKVIGVGGGGGNAVAQMYREGIGGVRFLAANTDSKALADSPLPDRLQMGPGLGAGGNPEAGRAYAEESVEKIRRLFDDGTKMVFITAGMGGGTGTGASPVIAREAMGNGILTVGVVTLPFLFERERQIDKALDGLEALSKEVDAVLVINNQRLCDIYPALDIISGFRKADEALTNAVRSIVEIIGSHGKIGLDFRDVANVLTRGGMAVMSTGYGEGEGRMTKAIEAALYSPLLNNTNVYSARRLVISITTSPEEGHTLMMDEINELNNFTAKFCTDITTKWGLVLDESVGSKVKVTILASGFSLTGSRLPAEGEQTSEPEEETDPDRLMRRTSYYAAHGYPADRRIRQRHRSKVYLFDTADLTNEHLIAAVDASPTARRSAKTLSRLCALSATRKATPASETDAPPPAAPGAFDFSTPAAG